MLFPADDNGSLQLDGSRYGIGSGAGEGHGRPHSDIIHALRIGHGHIIPRNVDDDTVCIRYH
ncbi:hypothetical protein D3C73_1479180 [compost metagenome]